MAADQVVVAAAAIAQVAVAAQAVASVVVAAVTAAKPQRSNINTEVLLREQQGVN